MAARSFWPLVLSPSGARVDFGGGGSPPGVWAAARWRAAEADQNSAVEFGVWKSSIFSGRYDPLLP